MGEPYGKPNAVESTASSFRNNDGATASRVSGRCGAATPLARQSPPPASRQSRLNSLPIC